MGNRQTVNILDSSQKIVLILTLFGLQRHSEDLLPNEERAFETARDSDVRRSEAKRRRVLRKVQDVNNDEETFNNEIN